MRGSAETAFLLARLHAPSVELVVPCSVCTAISTRSPGILAMANMAMEAVDLDRKLTAHLLPDWLINYSSKEALKKTSKSGEIPA